MKAPLLVDALRGRDPGAPGALYDTHGASLYRYCWFILRNAGAAQIALRDTLVVAEAHIGRLQTPALLRPWLFALARAECLRRQPSPGAPHDAAIARPDQPDADRRLIAWQAVTSLNALEREALELTIRHDMDVAPAALVLGLSPNETQLLLEQAREHLEQALAGEILARHGVHDCPERVAALQGWAGEMTVPLRERLVNHAKSCQACSRYLPRSVSATKVYDLLPVPEPPQGMRLRVVTCFRDPELVGYRMFVASRVDGFDELGFPDPEIAASVPRRISARVWSGPAAAVVAVAVLLASVFAISRLGGFDTAVQGVSSASGSQTAGVTPTPGGSGGSVPGTPGSAGPGGASRGPGPHEAVAGPTRGPGALTHLYLRGSPVPYRSSGSGPGSSPTGQPSPGRLESSPSELSLGTGSSGQVTLQAVGGPVTWTASASSPDITLSSDGGTIPAGQQVTITVDVTRAQDVAGQGTISFSGGSGGATVSVTWSDPASSSPPPPPSSSPTPTVITSAPESSPPRMRAPTPTPSPTAPAANSPAP